MIDVPPREVHHWWAHPGVADRSWLRLLDDGERERYAAYRQELDRQRFLVAAALIRVVAATVLHTRPEAVPVDRRCARCGRPHGKVRVPGTLELSISHSGDWVVVAAARTQPVGVDVEHVDPAVDYRAVAEGACTDAERKWLDTQNDDERASAFITLWTRKEAVLKAAGVGIGESLGDLVVTLPDEAPRVVSWSTDPALVHRIHLTDVTVDSLHRASLATIGSRPRRLVRHDGQLVLATIR